MRRRRDPEPSAGSALLAAAVAVAAAAGACTIPRERPAADGVHPVGWGDEASPRFHGPWLKQAGYPLADCRECHGDDYAGGPTGSSCVTGCHEQGVEACDTCHGADGAALPDSGAHGAHGEQFDTCEPCHVVPEDARGPLHPNGTAEVTFSGVGALDPAAAWDPATGSCAGVYCHGGAELPWAPPAPELGCDGCHGAPPGSHARWRVAAAPEGCAPCHPGEDDPRHVDGARDVLDLQCDACHGAGPLGAPPPGLTGSTDPADPGVGAHRRHLDATLDDRMGARATCADCHVVPESAGAPGHLDAAAPADVVLGQGGEYDPASGTCLSACHWDRDPGPRWTDASGAARACDACHGFPPATTRVGTVHPPAQSLSQCLSCHPFETERHVDGIVDLVP